MNILINLLLAVHIIVCLLIVVAVLMQRPKNEGLGAAFGGGVTDSLFGAQTTNVLATITRWLGVLFFGLTLLLSALYARQGRNSTGVQQKLESAAKANQPPVAPIVPPASAVEVPPVSTPAPADPAKTEPPAAPVESPKAPEPKSESAPVVPVEKAPTPAPVPSPESSKADADKEAAPILKVSAPELNPATPPPSAEKSEKPEEAPQ